MSTWFQKVPASEAAITPHSLTGQWLGVGHRLSPSSGSASPSGSTHTSSPSRAPARATSGSGVTRIAPGAARASVASEGRSKWSGWRWVTTIRSGRSAATSICRGGNTRNTPR